MRIVSIKCFCFALFCLAKLSEAYSVYVRQSQYFESREISEVLMQRKEKHVCMRQSAEGRSLLM
jgi:hypothetical protein